MNQVGLHTNGKTLLEERNHISGFLSKKVEGTSSFNIYKHLTTVFAII